MERELVAEVTLNGVSIVDIGKKVIEIGTKFDEEGWFGTRVEIETEGECHMDNIVTIRFIDKVGEQNDLEEIETQMHQAVGDIVDNIYYR